MIRDLLHNKCFSLWEINRNKHGLKRMLFNGTRQCNIQIFDKTLSQVKDKTNQSYRNK